MDPLHALRCRVTGEDIATRGPTCSTHRRSPRGAPEGSASAAAAPPPPAPGPPAPRSRAALPHSFLIPPFNFPPGSPNDRAGPGQAPRPPSPTAPAAALPQSRASPPGPLAARGLPAAAPARPRRALFSAAPLQAATGQPALRGLCDGTYQVPPPLPLPPPPAVGVGGATREDGRGAARRRRRAPRRPPLLRHPPPRPGEGRWVTAWPGLSPFPPVVAPRPGSARPRSQRAREGGGGGASLWKRRERGRLASRPSPEGDPPWWGGPAGSSGIPGVLSFPSPAGVAPQAPGWQRQAAARPAAAAGRGPGPVPGRSQREGRRVCRGVESLAGFPLSGRAGGAKVALRLLLHTGSEIRCVR